MNGLQSIRSKASMVTIGVLWLNAFLVLARVPFAGEASTMVLLVGALAVAGSATGIWLIDRTGPATRLVSGASHAALVALLVYSFTGSHLQIDMHMYFFATLAILAVWIDWRPIVAFTAVTAVHHLVLNFALPAAVFPGDADLVRVVIHAAILLLEAGLLLAIVRTTHAALVESEAALGQSLAARQEAAERAQEAETVRGAQELDRRTAADARAQEAEATRNAVDRLGEGLALLARGDLTARIDQPFDGALDGLRTNFNESVDGLRGSLSQVADSIGSIGDSAAEMRSASDNLLRRTEQQAASLEQTSAAFNEIAGAIRNASQHTQSARGLAEATATNTHRSRDVVVEAVAAMSRIEETSGKIGSITDLIDSIAFQTNLLALNAGVEAARAGDAGKGFAVVAQEVRALAQRAATAATDIKALIHQSGDEVQNGVRLVNSAGTALDEILGQVSSINETIASIATMAANEASGLQQVQVAIRQIDDVTQKNAAMVEENTAVTHRLAEDAASLRDLVGRFRLGGRQDVGAARRHAA